MMHFSQHSYFTVRYHKKYFIFIWPFKASHWHPFTKWLTTLLMLHKKYSAAFCMHPGVDPWWWSNTETHTYFLPCHQQVLVDVGAQEACIAVTFHQLVDVILNEQRGGDPYSKKQWEQRFKCLPNWEQAWLSSVWVSANDGWILQWKLGINLTRQSLRE